LTRHQLDSGALKTFNTELSARTHPEVGAESAEHVFVDAGVAENAK
jgi:hypothetical protein